MPDTDPKIIKLQNVRLSFPNLFKPKAMQAGQEPKFGATFLLDDKQHAELISQIEKMIERLSLDHFKKKVSLKQKCLHDGNEKSEMEGYGDGVHFITSSTKRRPAVVNRDLSPITEEDGTVYPGCYVNATVQLWVQDNDYGKGVNAELRAVQFVKNGDSFGAAPVNAEDEFEKLDMSDLDNY